MNNTFDDLSDQLENHCADVETIVKALLPFHEAREETYALSFAKRGESGVWMNLMRKTDRLDRLANKVFSGEGGNDGVTLVDTLVDTAMYALKWLAVIKQIRPNDLEKWVGDVYCKDVSGMTVEEALVLFSTEQEEGTLMEWLMKQAGIEDVYEETLHKLQDEKSALDVIAQRAAEIASHKWDNLQADPAEVARIKQMIDNLPRYGAI